MKKTVFSMSSTLRLPDTYPVACHTDHIAPGSVFVAIKGFKQDGVAFIPQAIAQGACKIVMQHETVVPQAIAASIQANSVEVIKVENARRALATLSAQAWGNPAKKLRIIAITGTKGKTTSAFLLQHVLQAAGYKTALLSTVKNSIIGYDFKTNLTTQQPDYLHMFFGLCVNAGVEYVIMETAAQAFSLDRVYGIEFDAVLFTNFDLEHAEFYPTMDEYFQAKCCIFKQAKPYAPRIINADNAWSAKLAENGYAQFGTSPSATFAMIPGSGADTQQKIRWQDATLTFDCPALIGQFNRYNVAGVVSVALSLGIAPAAIAQALASFAGVPGRFERYVAPNGASFIIDYAHNPSSYEQVLSTVRALTDHLIVLFGAGGERDKSKRPLMGEIAAQYADQVILTADNPRTEDLVTIIDDIQKGIAPEQAHKVAVVYDREDAIHYAYRFSKPGTIVMLLGKGPDEYQIVGTNKMHFSEAAIVKALQ